MNLKITNHTISPQNIDFLLERGANVKIVEKISDVIPEFAENEEKAVYKSWGTQSTKMPIIFIKDIVFIKDMHFLNSSINVDGHLIMIGNCIAYDWLNVKATGRFLQGFSLQGLDEVLQMEALALLNHVASLQ